MGYNTDFSGKMTIEPALKEEDHCFLNRLAETRRMARKVDPKYGVEGEFYVDGKGSGQCRENNIIDYNRPPKTQPGLWCNWAPTEDGRYLEWNGSEKSYDMAEWLEYIIEKILKPRGYSVSGHVDAQGEDSSDQWSMIRFDNEELDALPRFRGTTLKTVEQLRAKMDKIPLTDVPLLLNEHKYIAKAARERLQRGE